MARILTFPPHSIKGMEQGSNDKFYDRANKNSDRYKSVGSPVGYQPDQSVDINNATYPNPCMVGRSRARWLGLAYNFVPSEE
jgi:hypothetical protein